MRYAASVYTFDALNDPERFFPGVKTAARWKDAYFFAFAYRSPWDFGTFWVMFFKVQAKCAS